MKYLGKKIKEIRINKELTQRDIANRLEITQTSYQRIESGQTSLTIDRLKQIAEVFEVDFFELLGAGGANLDCTELEKEVITLRRENEDLRRENTDLREAYRVFRLTFINLYNWYENVLDKLDFAVELLKNIDDKSVDEGYQKTVEKSPEPERWRNQTPLGILSPILQFSSYMEGEYRKYVESHKMNTAKTK